MSLATTTSTSQHKLEYCRIVFCKEAKMALVQIQSRGLGCLHLPFQIAQKAVSKPPSSSKIYVNYYNKQIVQLSSASIGVFVGSAFQKMVGTGRVELPTSRLSVVRSNHLSYAPETLVSKYLLLS